MRFPWTTTQSSFRNRIATNFCHQTGTRERRTVFLVFPCHLPVWASYMKNCILLLTAVFAKPDGRVAALQ